MMEEMNGTNTESMLYAAPEDPTLDEYFGEWIRRKEKILMKEATPYRYRQYYKNHIHRQLGGRKIRELRRRDVIRLQTDLLDEVGPVTVNFGIQLLRGILNDAVADEIIFRNPCLQVKRLKEPVTAARIRHRALTEEEQGAFLQAAKGSWYYEYFAFLLCTGVRQGEGAALCWTDIDREENMIHVRRTLTFNRRGQIVVGPPKSEAGFRDIPMNAAIRGLVAKQRLKAAERWGEAALAEDRWVFPSSLGGALQNSTANIVLRRIQKQMREEGIRIEHFSAHALRDTFATRFIEQGGTPQTLKTILGHASLRMTMDLYAHVLPNTKQKEMDMIRIMV